MKAPIIYSFFFLILISLALGQSEPCVELVDGDKPPTGDISGIIEFTAQSGERMQKPDDCYTESEVNDYYCVGNSFDLIPIRCDYGCSDGKCKAPPPPPNSCEFANGLFKVRINNIEQDPSDFIKICYKRSDSESYFEREWNCNGQTIEYIDTDCAENQQCYQNRCTDILEDTQCDGTQFYCGDACQQESAVAQEDSCEKYDYGHGFEGLYRKINDPEYDGTCYYGKCIRTGCDVNYVQSEYCSNFIKDDDGDGVLNNEDDCPNTPHVEGLANNVNEYGCFPLIRQPIKSEGVCRKIAGTGDNVNIVITPCGFDEDEKSIFLYWVKEFADTFEETEPFRSYPDKFSLSYVWDTSKKDYNGYVLDASGNKVASEEKTCLPNNAHNLKLAKEITISAGCKETNLLTVEIQRNSLLAAVVTTKGKEAYAEGLTSDKENNVVISQGISWECPQNMDACIQSNTLLKGMFFHEIGHLFNSGHPFAKDILGMTDSQYTKHARQDYYSPEVYPISESGISDDICPIWDFPEYAAWAKTNAQDTGCYFGYNDGNSENPQFKYTYFSIIEPSFMQYKFTESTKYDPVSAKHIEDALKYGFDDFKGIEYPTKCEEIPVANYYTEILGYSESELMDMKNTCLKKACLLVDTSKKKSCCLPIIEEWKYLKSAALSLFGSSSTNPYEKDFQECIDGTN